MEQFLNTLIEGSSLPLFTVFLLGVLTSVSPCTFTTNITVLAYISKDVNESRQVFFNGLYYTLGRIISYTGLGLICIPILRQGASTFFIQKVLSSYGNLIFAYTLIIYGLFFLFKNKLTLNKLGLKVTQKSSQLKGRLGAFVLGLLFALVFCPVSAVLYFGMLLPLAAFEPGGYLYPVVFAVSSGILVILIAWIIAFSMAGIGKFYNRINNIQKWLNLVVAITFIIIGIYYLYMYHI